MSLEDAGLNYKHILLYRSGSASPWCNKQTLKTKACQMAEKYIK